jgi:chromosome segregation ATPase
MAEAESSVGQHLAELYNSIHQHEQKVEAAKAKVTEEEAALAKVKNQFADYLKQKGIYDLIAPAQAESSSHKASTNQKAESKERKPRTSSADKQAEVERNKATYVSAYPLGINERTGEPNRYKGRGTGNQEIDALMKDDKRDYEEKMKSIDDFLVPEASPEPKAAPKAASKSKTKAEAQPA